MMCNVDIQYIYYFWSDLMDKTQKKAATCCFLGHREITETEELKQQLHAIIENLISNENVNTFLFGSKSPFNSLCHEQVTVIRETYPHIKNLRESRISGYQRRLYSLFARTL